MSHCTLNWCVWCHVSPSLSTDQYAYSRNVDDMAWNTLTCQRNCTSVKRWLSSTCDATICSHLSAFSVFNLLKSCWRYRRGGGGWGKLPIHTILNTSFNKKPTRNSWLKWKRLSTCWKTSTDTHQEVHEDKRNKRNTKREHQQHGCFLQKNRRGLVAFGANGNWWSSTRWSFL